MSDFTSSSDASQYRADREYKHTERSTKVLDAIRDMPDEVPSRVPLQGDEKSAAVQTLLKKDYVQLKFPHTMKTRVDPPITRQNFGLVTFIPAKDAVPDKEGCYGIMKFRGAFASIAEAEDWGEHLIADYDSYADINICMIGREFPLMADDRLYTGATREIDIRQKVDDVQKANFRQKRDEENKQVREIQERRQKLLDKGHRSEMEKATDDMELYLELRVKKANALMARDEAEKTIQTSEEIIRKTDVVLAKIEESHPDYKDEYMERYKRALDAVGSNPANNPLIPYMIRDEQGTGSSASNTKSEVEEKKEES